MSSDQDPITGKVKFFDTEKGYGFLVPDGGGKDVFVHNLQVRRAGLKLLVPGESLRFTVSAARGRPEAMNLSRVAGEAAAEAPADGAAAPEPAPPPAPETPLPAAAGRPRGARTLSLRSKKVLESRGAKD